MYEVDVDCHKSTGQCLIWEVAIGHHASSLDCLKPQQSDSWTSLRLLSRPKIISLGSPRLLEPSYTLIRISTQARRSLPPGSSLETTLTLSAGSTPNRA